MSSDYNARLHNVKNWQVIASSVASVGVGIGSLFLPIKSGEIPVARIAAIVLSGGLLTASKIIADSKVELDTQKGVIDNGNRRVFSHTVSNKTGLEIEMVEITTDKKLAKIHGVPEDVAEYN